jgi:hypothetical protein
MMRIMRVFGLAGLVLSLGSCGSDAQSDPPPNATYLAFASSFADFRSWTARHSDGPADKSFPPDVLGPRTQYINRAPAKGSTSFPVGTIIVESRESGAKNIFAMVKRGGGFNESGARDWEWFELVESGSAVTIKWRGFGPPLGEVYGGDASGGCNACHTRFASNDYVASAQLQLGGF